MRSNFYAVSVYLAMTLGVMSTSTEALASGRQVVINDNVMNATQLAYFDNAHCERIPDGNYFLTQMANGVWVWGYAALPGVPLGYLGENCQGNQPSGSPGRFKPYTDCSSGPNPGCLTKTEEGCHIISAGGTTMNTCDF